MSKMWLCFKVIYISYVGKVLIIENLWYKAINKLIFLSVDD